VSSAARLTIAVAEGGWGTVECAVLQSGNAPAESFLEKDCEEIREKGKDQPQSTARARFMLLFQQMADHGRLSRKRFSKEMGRLFAFKHEVRNIQIRFPCIQDSNRWILTHGFRKPGAQSGLGDWPQSEVTRANTIANEYDSRKRQLGSKAIREKR
jgi:hypothetical protein